MGFTFVDRISAIEPDRARGQLRRPPGAPPLPPWLIIEAVGQLAAWIAMARCDFISRPVAALIGEVRLSGATAGGTVELEARIERWDGRAVLYSGRAQVDGRDLAVVVRGVGPLLPMVEFDEPAEVRRRFELLRGSGPLPGAGGAEAEIPRATLAAIESGDDSVRAQLHVPTSASYFAEHFPRRAVYPASLLADAQNQLAAPLAAALLGVAEGRVVPVRVADFKVRAFSPPGQRLDLVAHARSRTSDGATIAFAASADGKRVASGLIEYRIVPPPSP
jgi:3-hydroxymyristoyl/3-hydroxydecanoyl-(acyl carrier protein) dehydratase